MKLFLIQLLNGLQYGMTLVLVSSGLTLIFGILGVINLAHGALFTTGAFVAAVTYGATGSFSVALLAGVIATAIYGLVIEALIMRRLYQRDHMDQVLATFGLILITNEALRWIWGTRPRSIDPPVTASVEIVPGAPFPVYRLLIMATGVVVLAGLHRLITKTRIGMWIRAGAEDPETAATMGINLVTLYAIVFALGAFLAGLAGVITAPLLSVESGVGDNFLIVSFLVVVLGGVGSVKGAAVASVGVALIDTLGRAYLPDWFRSFFEPATADAAGSSVASMLIYLTMVTVLVVRPTGLFGRQLLR